MNYARDRARDAATAAGRTRRERACNRTRKRTLFGVRCRVLNYFACIFDVDSHPFICARVPRIAPEPQPQCCVCFVVVTASPSRCAVFSLSLSIRRLPLVGGCDRLCAGRTEGWERPRASAILAVVDADPPVRGCAGPRAGGARRRGSRMSLGDRPGGNTEQEGPTHPRDGRYFG